MADDEATLATHDLSHGGLAVGLAEMVHADAGAAVEIDTANESSPAELLFGEQPGRVLIETTDASAVREAFDGVAPVYDLGRADDSGTLDLTVDDESLNYDADTIADLRSVIAEELE